MILEARAVLVPANEAVAGIGAAFAPGIACAHRRFVGFSGILRSVFLASMMGTRKKRDTPRFFAALYLLTANEDIWRRAYNAFSVEGITPEYIRLCGISVPNYALVQAAKSIYLNTDHFTVEDLEDPEAVITDAFRLIVNAVLIARYGREVLKIKSEREETE